MATIGALTFIAGVLGLIKPSLLRMPNRKIAAVVLVIGFVITAAAGANSSNQQATNPLPAQQPAQQATQQPQQNQQQAQPQQPQPQKQEQSKPPSQQQEKPKGIGVSRAAIQSVYEKPELGFKFEKGEPVDGQPQVIGRAPNGLAFVQLIGPEEDLTQATIMVGIPNDNPQALVENSAYMLGLLKLAAPDWKEGADWLSSNLVKAVEEGEVATTHGNLRIRLQAIKELGMAALTVAVNE